MSANSELRNKAAYEAIQRRRGVAVIARGWCERWWKEVRYAERKAAFLAIARLSIDGYSRDLHEHAGTAFTVTDRGCMGAGGCFGGCGRWHVLRREAVMVES